MGDTRNEPSMEDILASIKRIIADDGAAALNAARPKPQPAARAEPAEPAPTRDPVPSTPEAATDDPADGVLELTEPVADPGPAPEFVSSAAAKASRQSLASLSAVVVRQEPEPVNTLESLVRELLRPLLKDWLDARLPGIVEELVAKEIARITGKSL